MSSNKLKSSLQIIGLLSIFLLTSCYSVFSGVASGRVVDSESTSTPKTGIADVDIYAYTNKEDRDNDFSSWNGSDKFHPKAEYFCHTNSGNDGRFTLSRLIWKTEKSKFGKDADYSTIYLIFFHENYGLVKSEERILIVSDSTSDSVFQELTRIKKSTVLNINVNDVVSGQTANPAVSVKISVPQSTSENVYAAPKVYETTILGQGRIEVSYPRWQSDEQKNAKIETEPEIQISYKMAEDEVTWKSCYNRTNEAKDYAFFDSEINKVSKKISGEEFGINLYGKPTKIEIPSVSGIYGTDPSNAENDGVLISMKASLDNGENYTEDLGEVSTFARDLGTAGNQEHGNFQNLGNGFYIFDESYTGKYAEIKVQFFVNGNANATTILRSDNRSYNVKLK
ncbi:MAG: hypothetical protein MJ182_02450 [Treponema sp.]|nr:hypothetical protein [Treponema sp.]